jgi:hypothetical protein
MGGTTLPFFAAVLCASFPIKAHADESSFVRGDWSFQHSEGAGIDAALCTLSVSTNPSQSANVLHMEASPGKPIVAFTRTSLSKESTATWEVDDLYAAYFFYRRKTGNDPHWPEC